MIAKAIYTTIIVAWAFIAWYGDMKGWTIANLIPFREEENESRTGSRPTATDGQDDGS